MLHSAPRGSLCAEAFTAIEADLEAFSPGRVAAVGVRGGLAEQRKASELFKRNSHDQMTHATNRLLYLKPVFGKRSHVGRIYIGLIYMRVMMELMCGWSIDDWRVP